MSYGTPSTSRWTIAGRPEPLDDLDDPGEERLDRIASNDLRARVHEAGIARLVEEGPHEARAVDLLHVG